MTEQRSHFNSNEFPARPKGRHWWPKVIAMFAVVGGIYGAALGSAISTTAGAAEVIAIAAAIMAVLCGVPGARFGFFFGILNRARFAHLFFGMLATMGGAIFGGLLGLTAVMPLGAIPGALGGWLLARAILRQGFFKRLFGSLVGPVLGGCVGSIILAIQRDQGAALVGMAWGLGMGAVVAPLPLVLFVKMIDSLVPRRHRHTEGDIIDVHTVDAPNDEIDGPRHDES